MNASEACPAVITAAGHGTRFHPFSDIVPKEMLPIGSRPALGHVIEECLAAGARPIFVVVRPDDHVIPAFIDRLRAKGAPVQAIAEDLTCGYGNAAPLLTLRERLAGSSTFVVAFGDDILLGGPRPGTDLTAMRALIEPGAGTVIAAQLIDRADIDSFGIIDVHEDDRNRVIGIRQRPDPATVTEPLAVVSRLVLRPEILDLLTPRIDAGGEVDLGIAVGEHAHVADVRVHRLEAEWATVGDPRRYFDALTRYRRAGRAHPDVAAVGGSVQGTSASSPSEEPC